GGLLDRDQALHEAARPIEEGALRKEVAGRVAADVAGVRGQVEQLLLAAEDDLDLLDRAAVALEAVIDARADEARAELRQRPAERGALADTGVPMLEDDLVRAHLLDRREREAGAGAEADLGGAVEQPLRDYLARGAVDLGAGRDELFDDRGRCSRPKGDAGPADESTTRGSARPAQDDR